MPTVAALNPKIFEKLHLVGVGLVEDERLEGRQAAQQTRDQPELLEHAQVHLTAGEHVDERVAELEDELGQVGAGVDAGVGGQAGSDADKQLEDGEGDTVVLVEELDSVGAVLRLVDVAVEFLAVGEDSAGEQFVDEVGLEEELAALRAPGQTEEVGELGLEDVDGLLVGELRVEELLQVGVVRAGDGGDEAGEVAGGVEVAQELELVVVVGELGHEREAGHGGEVHETLAGVGAEELEEARVVLGELGGDGGVVGAEGGNRVVGGGRVVQADVEDGEEVEECGVEEGAHVAAGQARV
jgi:hypothetical protein